MDWWVLTGYDEVYKSHDGGKSYVVVVGGDIYTKIVEVYIERTVV